MEMTKWFDTNYHYIVPEFTAHQKFTPFSNKMVNEFIEAKQAGFNAKPVLLGPVSYLLLGKEKEEGFHRLELIKKLLPAYINVLAKLEGAGAYYVQLDEPCLALDLTPAERQVFVKTYQEIKNECPHLRIILASYVDCYGKNLETALSLPVHTIHLDLVRCPSQLDDILATPFTKTKTNLSLGLVDGRNIWKNDFQRSLSFIDKAVKAIGAQRIWIAPSCSLLHSPCDLDLEANDKTLTPEIKQWLAFAKQKIAEVSTLRQLATGQNAAVTQKLLAENTLAQQNRKTSPLIHNKNVTAKVAAITKKDAMRNNSFAIRKDKQHTALGTAQPTTTIGSFPQTTDVRSLRARFKKGDLTQQQYDQQIEKATEEAIRWQEEIGIDVLVHGEFERNDMVEYFGEQTCRIHLHAGTAGYRRTVAAVA